jgi:hypothetical protein
MSTDLPDPPDGTSHGRKLEYRRPEPRRFYWSIGTGCLVVAVVLVVIIGVVFGTCMLKR